MRAGFTLKSEDSTVFFACEDSEFYGRSVDPDAAHGVDWWGAHRTAQCSRKTGLSQIQQGGGTHSRLTRNDRFEQSSSTVETGGIDQRLGTSRSQDQVLHWIYQL